MGGQHVELEVAALDVEAGFGTHLFEQRVGQAAGAKRLGRAQQPRQARGRLRQRHKTPARLLRQALEQRLQLVFEHARHQPLATVVAHLVQHKQRHRHREAVARVARLVQVGGRAVHPAQADGLGKRVGGDACRLVPHEFVAREQQQRRVLFALCAVPGLEGEPAAHLGRQLLVIESVDQFVVDQHVLPARLVLQLLHLGNELLVGGQERQLRLPTGQPPALLE